MPIFADRSYGFAEQDAAAFLDYTEDWSIFLVGDDGIVESQWSADSDEIVLTDPLISNPLTTVWVSGGVSGKTYRIANIITTAQGRRDVRYFYLTVTDGASIAPAATALFSRMSAVEEFKRESLAFLDRSFPIDQITDDYIWDSLVAAESEASHALRVFMRPTVILPEDAPQSEIDALVAAGTPYALEAPYDYQPTVWSSDGWGHMLVRQKPVIRVDSVRFTYPNPSSDVLTVPNEWLRMDKRYGQIRFVPTGAMMGLGPFSTYIMTAMASGRIIPGMIHVRYVAGLENPRRDYPDLVKLIKRMAILTILKSAFLPQSGSISADGLSQSSNVDTGKWQDDVDRDLNQLRDKIHGIRFEVF